MRFPALFVVLESCLETGLMTTVHPYNDDQVRTHVMREDARCAHPATQSAANFTHYASNRGKYPE